MLPINHLSIFDNSDVTVLCSCKRYLPLCRTFFCRYCFEIRCYYCITQEIDGYYCSTCLENIASGEANQKRDKCTNCVDCPSCGNMLSIRASVFQVPNPDSAAQYDLQKMYYMACCFCRWTTRDSGIPDKKTSSSSWSQQENTNVARIKELIDSFNQYAVKEKLEKEKTKYASRKNYFYLLDSGVGKRRYSSQMRSNRRISAADAKVLAEAKKPIKIKSVSANDDIDELDESIFTQKFQLEEITNIQQRLRNPEHQPHSVTQFYPINKQILAKKSMRCKKCDHNLCKPEIATNSTRFKINLGSVFHVPDLKIHPFEAKKFEDNKPIKLILTLQNPAHRVTKIRLENVEDLESNAKLEISSKEFQISAKNEIVALDEMELSTNEFHDDDPKEVSSRSLNKLSLHAQLTPRLAQSNNTSDSDVSLCSYLRLWFEYKDLTSHFTTGASAAILTGPSGDSSSSSSIRDDANSVATSWRSVVFKLDFGTIN